jgi:hypothetical protein
LRLTPKSLEGCYSERRRCVGEGEEALLWVDLGDVVDADQDSRPPEQAGTNLEHFGLVRRFPVANTGDTADPLGRRLDEEALAAAQLVAAVVARAGRVVPLV